MAFSSQSLADQPPLPDGKFPLKDIEHTQRLSGELDLIRGRMQNAFYTPSDDLNASW